MTVSPRWEVFDTLMPLVALDSNSGMGLSTTIAMVLQSRVTGCVIRSSRGPCPVTALLHPRLQPVILLLKASVPGAWVPVLTLIHISEPTRLGMISYAVFCL